MRIYGSNIGGSIALLVTLLLYGAHESHAINILPLGDSITEGLCSDSTPGTCTNPYAGDPNSQGTNAYNIVHYNNTAIDFCGVFARDMVQNYNPSATGGYRGPLLTKLRAAGLSANYKGHVASGTSLAAADRNHEGHGGWSTEHVSYCLNGYMNAQTPDTVLLDIGANNILGGTSPTTVATSIIAIKSQAENRAPKPRVLTALLSPGYNLAVSDYTTKSKQINNLVAQQSGRDFPCTARDLPDMSVLTVSDLQDGLHPTLAGYEKMATIWFNALTTPECKFDTRTFVSIGGVLVESITAYGRFWNFNSATGAWLGNGTLNTSDLPRYNLICNGKPVCTLDTRTFLPGTNGSQESITAFNSYWTFPNSGNSPVATGTLSSVPRYAQYICVLAGGSSCKFDTRSVLVRSGINIEAITAYGHYFEFNLATNSLITSGTIASTTKYASICAYKPTADLYCTFDTRTYVQLPNIPYLESISAYGRYWNLDANTGALLDSGLLSNVHGRYYP